MINEAQAKSYCSEDISKIENYDKAVADPTQTWICHHRTAIWWNCSRKDLIENECYHGRKACELLFVTKEEHNILHHTGKTVSKDTKKKMSESHKWQTAERNPFYGKTHSEDTKKKISEAAKAREARRRAAKQKAAAEGGV